MARTTISYETFKENFLIENYTNKLHIPVHTRYYKKYFYRFRKELKKEFGFDILTCSNKKCGITSHVGRPIIMELDHINRITNDARIKNLRPLCPNCHQQTLGYKNRKISIEEYFQKLLSF
jgi:5-methylcytosine-specific restriction endonuclease McrA